MKKNLFFTLLLCLSVLLSCEQQTIFDQLTKDTVTHTANSRGGGTPCELEKIPLYIPPVTTVLSNTPTPSNTMDFSIALPVTESTDYESFNSTNVTVQSVTYSVNGGTPTTNSSFSYIQNTNYNLVIHVNYAIGPSPAVQTETFSLLFNVTNTKELTWGRTNWCEYEEIESRSSTVYLILP